MAGTYGNQNARRGQVWSDAVRRALDRRTEINHRDALEELAEKLIECCMDLDPRVRLEALTELGNRLEGRPRQQVEIETGGSLTELLTRLALDRNGTAADPPLES